VLDTVGSSSKENTSSSQVTTSIVEDEITGARSSSSSSSSYTVEIRPCRYADLNEAVDVIMSSYYAKMKNPWLQMYRLGELNRLQQNFPRMDHVDLHCMFVAIARSSATTTINIHKNNNTVNGEDDSNPRTSTRDISAPPPTIIGFCDVDGRTPNRPTGYDYNPRPYASDICVDPAFRRRGIGQQLVRACEDFARHVMRESQVYLRVEAKNTAAIQMYTGLGYKPITIVADIAEEEGADDLTSSTKIILLRKQLDD
jgi:ribosomal protein S18 acetylase RimI-like enzyme